MKRIRQISVSNLFGMFSYVIPLHMDDRITIIHGPNGFGKTAILRLLNEVFHKSTAALRSTPFNELRIDFDDDSTFLITKDFENTSKDRRGKHSNLKITFQLTDRAKQKQSYTLPPLTPPDRIAGNRTLQLSIVDHIIPELDRIAETAWRLIPTGEFLSLEEVLERFSDRLPSELTVTKEPDWLKDIRQAIPIRFIETQRLLNPTNINKRSEFERHPGPTMVPTVRMYAEELADTIKTKLAESTALSQSLDRTFPSRLVSPSTRQRSLTEVELRNKLAELESKRSDLMAAGLIDQDNNDTVQILEDDEIDPSTKTVLSVYVEDVEQKLGIFDEIANKIDLLKRIINKRFLYKEMSISRKNGFIFTTSNGASLSPTDLSSGEQHELVLFYELLFKVAPGSLILIDEPELSLHVVWQEQFLHDIQEITRLSDIDALLATHSPDIIGDRRDLVVELEGPK